MITGKQNITAFFDQVQRPFFKVYKMGQVQSGNTVYESPEDDNYSFEAARVDFQKWLNIQTVGRFTLCLSAGAKFPAKGKMMQDFDIPISDSQPPAISQPVPTLSGIGSINPEEIENRALVKAKEMFEKMQLQADKDRLEKENTELKKELKAAEKNSGGIGAVVDKLQPYMGSIISAFTSKPAAAAAAPIAGGATLVTGVDDEETEETARLTKVLQVFARHDEEWLNTLERLAAKLDENPALLNMIKGVI